MHLFQRFPLWYWFKLLSSTYLSLGLVKVFIYIYIYTLWLLYQTKICHDCYWNKHVFSLIFSLVDSNHIFQSYTCIYFHLREIMSNKTPWKFKLCSHNRFQVKNMINKILKHSIPRPCYTHWRSTILQTRTLPAWTHPLFSKPNIYWAHTERTLSIHGFSPKDVFWCEKVTL